MTMYKTVVLCCVQFPTPLQFGACDQSYESGGTGGELDGSEEKQEA